MLVERRQLARDLIRRADEVGVVGVLRRHSQRLTLARPADHQRDVAQGGGGVDRVVDGVPLAVQAGALAAEHRGDDLQRLLEPLEPVGERAELEAERLVLELVPARADAELRAADRDDVEGGDDLRKQGRIAVGVAGDQRGQPHPRGPLAQRREHRVALEHRVVRRPEHRRLVEVIHEQDGVEAALLGLDGLPRDGLEEARAVDVRVGEVGDLVARRVMDARYTRVSNLRLTSRRARGGMRGRGVRGADPRAGPGR